jgi:hypothetical protein
MSVSNFGKVFGQTPTAGPSCDAELERALFQLMGQLEQILVRMDAVSETKRLPGSIEIAKELLVELVEFAEARFEKAELLPLIDRVCDFHDHTKRLEKMLGGQSWNGFAAFIGIKMSYSDEVKAMFQELGKGLIEAIGGFFQLFESRFQSRDDASEWEASSQVFLDDLIRRWNLDSRAHATN